MIKGMAGIFRNFPFFKKMASSASTRPLGKPIAVRSNLSLIRRQEGLSKAKLARLAGVSDRTIREAEKGKRHLREETLHQILNALNKNPNRISEREYQFEEVFPPDQAEIFDRRERPAVIPSPPEKEEH